MSVSRYDIPTYEVGTNLPVDVLRDHPVEGMRPTWREQLLLNYPRPNMPGVNRAYYLGALKALAAQFQPPAFERATPVARFQHQFEATVRMIEQAVPFNTLAGQPGYRVVNTMGEVGELRERHRVPDIGGIVIKQASGDDGPEELYCYMGYSGVSDFDPNNTWAFRVL